jgi:peptidoglycan hydrolase FlgJ
MSVESIGGPASPRIEGEDARLRQAARDLEGVFVAELFKAMRETVPEGGLTDGGMGEEMFTSMLDQKLAPQVGAGWNRGIGDALYRQLRGALTQPAPGGSG